MSRGDKSAYTDKQKRQVKHIEEGYLEQGVPKEEAKRRAWATENKISGGGYQNNSLNNLISAPNLFWSLGASVAQAIFDGGQRRLASAQAQSAADQATSTYRQTVLTALQEVEDNLILAAQLQQETQLQRESLEAAQRTLEITLDQYRAGTVSYLNVVIAQNTALTSENSLLSTQNRQLAAVNILLKNIAGRWEPDNPDAAKAKKETKVE